MFGTKPWMTLLWPGLTQVWMRGSWTALAVAVVVGGTLNTALLATLVWRDLLPEQVRNTLWLAIGVLWAAGAFYSAFCESGAPPHRRLDPAEDAFPKAVAEYLKGNWYEAERTLAALLRQDVRDVPARLLLVSLLRRTGRLEEAGRQLDTLARFETADPWELEMKRERQQIHSQSHEPETSEGLRPAA